MFQKQKHEIEIKQIKSNFEIDKTRLIADNEIRLSQLRNENELKLKDKEFQITHIKDVEIKKAHDELVVAEKKIAVFEKEVEMMKQITDVNGDIIDVKDLVKTLIGKLPEFKINNLTVEAHSHEKSEKSK